MKHIVKINTLGGIYIPNNLKEISEIAATCGVKNINFGPRQEIFFNVHKAHLEQFNKLMSATAFEYEVDSDIYPSIVSSYPAEGIFSGDYWLSEGIYKDIFDQFDFKPKLKVNICDNDQTLVPFFTGELNFIASYTYQYWFLYLNFKENDEIIKWNKLIYSTDIPKICHEIEELYINNKIIDANQIMDLVNENTKFLFQDIDKELNLPRFTFPYYEGVNTYGSRLWTGVYRRDYLFPITYISDLCQLCNVTNISQLCVTPWRTVLIKGIEKKDRIFWEKLNGKHGINLRHSATELNWVVEDINSGELELKKFVIQGFDEKDTRTFGLVFGIQLQSSGKYIPASVVIEEKPFIQKDDLRLLSTFDIYFKDNFNPNSHKKNLFSKNVRKGNLVQSLLDLSKKYYEQLTEDNQIVKVDDAKKVTPKSEPHFIYQCKHCFTVYDAAFGDLAQDIKSGISFENLPAHYTCPTCDAPKNDFEKINAEILKHA